MHDAARSRVAAAQSNWTQYPHGQTAKGLVHSIFSRFGARSISRDRMDSLLALAH